MIENQYPIGKYAPQPFSEINLQNYLVDIQFLPQQIENAILNLNTTQLNTHYRQNGWTIIQLVHHVADSHMNAYIRFKLGLTEKNPTQIRPYNEADWALLADYKNVPINISITLLHALHIRWMEVLKAMTIKDFEKTIFHPEHKIEMTLWYLLGMYAWHGKHHTAQILGTKF